MLHTLALLTALVSQSSPPPVVVQEGCSARALVMSLQRARSLAPKAEVELSYEGRLRGGEARALVLAEGDAIVRNERAAAADLYVLTGLSRQNLGSTWAALVNPSTCRLLWARELAREGSGVL